MSARHTNESFVAAAKKVHGDRYDYSKVAYATQNVHVTIKCVVHGDFTITPRKHLDGSGCRKCYIDSTRKSPEEFIAQARAVHGDRYDYSKVEYKNTNKLVTIVCPEHGEFKQTPRSHLNGYKCIKCSGVNLKSQDEFLRLAREKHGDKYDYSKTVYRGSKEKITLICPTHGEFSQTAEVHYTGGGCRKCNVIDRSRAASRERFTKTKAAIEDRDLPYSYDFSGAENTHGLVHITCDKGHLFTQRADGATKYKCPTCARRHSKGEAELLEFVKSLVPAKRTRKVIPPKELDVWCPDHKLAFEYNGLYYHSNAFPDAKWRHKEKSDAVRAAGGRLVHIWADDWTYRRSATQNMIRAQLGLLPRVGARETEVRPVETAQARAFLEANHLQGYTNGQYLGLWLGEELVACMGFSVAQSVRGNRDPGLWELVRFCASKSVVGGASRLLAAWKATARDWHTLITYCDLSVFDGGLYEALGFTKVSVSPPDYKVILAGGTERLHKSHVRKSNLKKLLGDKYDDAKSEAQMCEENSIFRVWDCGRAKYEMKNQAA